MMNFLKDWIIQYQNKFSVGGVETTIDRITGTVSQEGDTIMASYLNEIQKNCIYQVNATRVVEGVLEIYDISIDGSEEFTPFNQVFIVDFSATNTKVDSLLRFNGNTYSLRFSDSISNGDIAPKIGFLPKRALVKLDVKNSKAIIVDFNPNNFISPAFTGTPTAPTATAGATGQQLANLDFVNAMLGGNTVPANYLSENGYAKMANGLIIQWGRGAGEYLSVIFPIVFPNACLNVVVSANVDAPGSSYTYASKVKTTNTSLATLYVNAPRCYWIAIGY